MRLPPIVELRRYTLRPGQRDVLVELFDRAFLEGQEAYGMAILGQFRDLDDAERFVWLRGFPDMVRRFESLTGFYTGPVWKANSAPANATMLDVANVLLLRPARLGAAGGGPGGAGGGPVTRPAVGAVPPDSRVLATIRYLDAPAGAGALADAARADRPFALLHTEYAENTFPALPVREGVHAVVSLRRFAGDAELAAHLSTVDMMDPDGPAVERLRLAPTARSLMR